VLPSTRCQEHDHGSRRTTGPERAVGTAGEAARQIATALLLATLMGACIVVQTAHAGPSREVNLAGERRANLKVNGPVTLHLKGINRLRYDVTVGDSVSTLTADKVSAILPPAPGAQAPADSAEQASDKTNRLLVHLKDVGGISPGPLVSIQALSGRNAGPSDLTRLNTEISDEVEAPAREALDKLRAAATDLRALVFASDGILSAPSGEKELVASVATCATTCRSALSAEWPSTRASEIGAEIDQLRSRAQSLAASSKPAARKRSGKGPVAVTASDQTKIAAALDVLSHMAARLALWADGSAHENEAVTLRGRLRQWMPILGSLRAADDFDMTLSVDQSASICDGSTHRIEARYLDRTTAVGEDSVQATATPIVVPVLTVVNEPRLRLSFGWGFSRIPADDYTAVTNTQGKRVLGLKDHESQRAPIALANFRIADLPNSPVEFWVSAGPTLNLQGSGSTVGVGLFGGLSASLVRHFFVTAGWFRGPEHELDGGFTLGQELPDTVDNPSTHPHEVTKVGLAVTIAPN